MSRNRTGLDEKRNSDSIAGLGEVGIDIYCGGVDVELFILGCFLRCDSYCQILAWRAWGAEERHRVWTSFFRSHLTAAESLNILLRFWHTQATTITTALHKAEIHTLLAGFFSPERFFSFSVDPVKHRPISES